MASPKGYADTTQDETIAQAVQEEEYAVGDAAVASEESSDDGETSSDEVAFTKEMLKKVLKEYDIDEEFQEVLLGVSSIGEIQSIIDEWSIVEDDASLKRKASNLAKRKMEVSLNAKNKAKNAEKGEPSTKSLIRNTVMKICVRYNGKDYIINLRGGATFKSLRSALITSFPDVFTSDKVLKDKMVFRVAGKLDCMNVKSRREMSWWGAQEGEILVIEVEDGIPPKTKSKATSKAASKAATKKPSKKDDEHDKDKDGILLTPPSV
eukprot:s1305_g20.t1